MRFSELSYFEAPKIVTPIPGPNSKEAVAIQKEFESNVVSYAKAIPLCFEEGRGARWLEMARDIRKRCYPKGLIVELGGHYNNVVRFLSPLILTEELADKGLSIFAEAVKEQETCSKGE